jgi:glutathione S-transferase
LEEAYPATSLLATTPKDKALVTMWERRDELEGFAAVMEGVRNATPRSAGRAIAGPHDYSQIPELVERSKRRAANFFSDTDARLAEVPFIAVETFSVAGITTLATVDFATRELSMPIRVESAALKRWYNAVAARPGATVQETCMIHTRPKRDKTLVLDAFDMLFDKRDYSATPAFAMFPSILLNPPLCRSARRHAPPCR